jgi:hypothetical protein
MRSFAAVALATSLFVSNAFAAANVSTLVPGKPAGVKHAQSEQGTLLLVLGVGVVAAGIALVASSDSRAPTPAPTPVTTTTTTTSTTTT